MVMFACKVVFKMLHRFTNIEAKHQFQMWNVKTKTKKSKIDFIQSIDFYHRRSCMNICYGYECEMSIGLEINWSA